MKPARLRVMPRARRDIEECVKFVAQFPRGKPEARRREICAAFRRLCEFPELHAVEVWRRRSGIELRRHHVGQFAIVYAYFRPTEDRPWAVVTIRAVRHRRVADAFLGVRESVSAKTIAGI
jgi:plasmid stabilization system protein ParE